MSFEDWKKESVISAVPEVTVEEGIKPESTGFESWKQHNVDAGLVSAPIKMTKEIADLAYKSYQNTLLSMGKAGTTQGWTRQAFESSGEAKKWVDSGLIKTPRSHFKKLEESYKRGKESFLTDQAYFDAVMLGVGEPDALYSEWKKQQAKEQADPIEGNLLTEMEYGSARIMPGMLEGGKQALPEMAGGAAIAAIAGQLGPQALTPEEIITVPAAMGIGFKIGATYAWYKQGAGEMLLTMRDKGFDEGASKIIASIAALPYALIEQIQIGQLTPGLRQGANKVIQKSVIKLMGQVAKKYGKTLTQEVLEEVAQEGVMIMAEDLAGYFSGQGIPVDKAELQQRAHRLWRTMVESTKSMALLPIPGAVVDMRVGDKGLKLAKKFADAGYDKNQSAIMARQIDEGKTIPEAHDFTVTETVVDTHNKQGGSTIDWNTGRAVKAGFPVGIGETETLDKEKITPDDITKFRNEHTESLQIPGRQIGTWYDKENKKSVLDVVEIATTEEAAIETGRKYGERYVYNLETGEEIAVTPAINVYRGIESGKLYEDESMLRAEKTETGTRLVDKETGEEVILDQEASKGALKAESQIEPQTPDQAIGKQYGITPQETQNRLDQAEEKFRELKNKPVADRTVSDKQELAFLRRKRKDIQALLNRETQPMEPKRMTRKQALALGHKIPDLLGWTEDQRRTFMKGKVGIDSMKNMSSAQREQIVTALKSEAEKAGIEIDVPDSTPAGELIAKLEERKQKPALTRRDKRNMKKLRKVLYTMKSGTSFYFLHTARLKRLCRSLDNYEDNGPFMQYIYQPVKDADTKANVNFSNEMAAAIVTLNDLNIDAPAMMVEVKDIGIKDKLSTAERIGVWALAQNENTMNHLLSEFSKEEIATIVKSVKATENEMLVAAEVQTYFEQGWPQFEATAKAHGITGMTKAENYITAFVADKNGLDTPNFLEGLMAQFTEGKFVPGQQHTIERQQGARRNLELNIFVIHARAARAIERFKAMAPVADKVGSMLSNRGLKQSLNDVTYGHGARMFDRWLQDAVRGQAAYDSSAIARSLRWLRMAGIQFVLGFKILTAGKQGISLFPAAGVHPGMIPLLLANLEQATVELKYGRMEKEAMGKSDLLRTRDWNRDLRQVYNQKAIRKMYQGKKLSPASMRMATYIDRHTCTLVWTSAYQLAQRQDMTEEESIRFADGVIEDTQPMGKAVDLPSFFRGNELEKNLTTFQNQINQNFNMFWYDILGQVKAKKISPSMGGYRLLMSHIVPAMLLGMITRGRPPKSVEEVAKDLLFYMLCPFVFVGRFVYNAATGDWGPTRMIAEEPFVETARLAAAVKRGFKEGLQPGELKSIAKYTARTAGAWTGGKIPLQAITTAEGAWDLATEQDTDFRRLVWSKYALKRGKSKKKDLRKRFKR